MIAVGTEVSESVLASSVASELYCRVIRGEVEFSVINRSIIVQKFENGCIDWTPTKQFLNWTLSSWKRKTRVWRERFQKGHHMSTVQKK